MSNALRCREMATRYAAQAELCVDPEERRAYGELHRLWAEMATFAERFDNGADAGAKAKIYAMMEEVEVIRQKVA